MFKRPSYRGYVRPVKAPSFKRASYKATAFKRKPFKRTTKKRHFKKKKFSKKKKMHKKARHLTTMWEAPGHFMKDRAYVKLVAINSNAGGWVNFTLTGSGSSTGTLAGNSADGIASASMFSSQASLIPGMTIMDLQYAGFYIHGSKVEVDFICTSLGEQDIFPADVCLFPYTAQAVIIGYPTTMALCREQPYAQVKTVYGPGEGAGGKFIRLTKYMSTRKIQGETNIHQSSYLASSIVQPVNMWNWVVYAQSSSLTAGQTQTYQARWKITYYMEWVNRLNVSGSQLLAMQEQGIEIAKEKHRTEEKKEFKQLIQTFHDEKDMSDLENEVNQLGLGGECPITPPKAAPPIQKPPAKRIPTPVPRSVVIPPRQIAR